MPSAREAYHGGTRNCPDSVVLWRLAAALEERCGTVTKARSLLEVGRLKNPKNPMLYLEAIRLERRVPGNEKLADSLMARALQVRAPRVRVRGGVAATRGGVSRARRAGLPHQRRAAR